MDDPLIPFATLVVLCTCCGAPVMIVGMMAYAFGVDLPRKRAALKQLADQMGLTPTEGSQHGRRYAGRHQAHAFQIGFGVKRRTRLGPERLRHTYGLALLVVMEVQMPEPLRGYAGCNRYPELQENFEAAFGKARMGLENLSPTAGSAMLAFARRRGDLWLHGLPLHAKAEPAPEYAVRLEHTLAGMEITPDEVRAVLDEMLEIARVLETTMTIRSS